MSVSHPSSDVRTPTLDGALAHWARDRPQESFVIEVETGRTLTYSAALRSVRDLQVWLGEPPRTIAVALPAGIESMVLWLAALTGGHRLVPCSPDATAAEYADLAQRWHPDLYVAAAVDPVRGALGQRAAAIDGHRLRDLTRPGPADRDDSASRWHSREGELALTTSGTTGAPKGLRLRADAIAWTADQIRRSHKLTAEDRGLAVLPFYHVNAPVVSLCTTLIAGATVIIAPRFSLSRFWTWIERERITWASVVPTLVALLLRGEEPRRVPESLRFVRTASAPLPVVHMRAFERRFGVPLIETYGLSEAASTVTANPVPPGIHKPGSVGQPLDGMEVRICTPADSQEAGALCDVERGHEGEVCVRGPSVIAGYEARAVDPSFIDGWFRTGDLGYQDTDGYLYLTGRLRDVINHGGHKIAPRAIEEVLLSHPNVREVAVIGQPDPLYGERVVAYVVPEAGTQPCAELNDLLVAYCAQHLSAYKVPEEVVVVARLPRTGTGKVQRHLLSAEQWSELERDPNDHAQAAPPYGLHAERTYAAARKASASGAPGRA
jgi:acyl-CoA synthetase (AMP-forming)/AMP-acid ligase II